MGDGAYKISGGVNGGFIAALLITIIAFIVVFFLIKISIILGGLLFLWEGLNFKMWIDAIKLAKTDEEFNKANFSQFVVSFLGLATVAAPGTATVQIALWYGIFMSFILTNSL